MTLDNLNDKVEKYLAGEDEDGWKLYFCINHHQFRFWYEIEDDKGEGYNFTSGNPFHAIAKIEQLKESNKPNN